MQDDRKQFLADVLVTAVEGGINYWAMVSNYHFTHPLTTTVDVHELDDDGNPGEAVPISIGDIDKAIRAILDDKGGYPPHLRSAIYAANIENDAGDIDAELADVIMQVAVLGELTYG